MIYIGRCQQQILKFLYIQYLLTPLLLNHQFPTIKSPVNPELI